MEPSEKKKPLNPGTEDTARQPLPEPGGFYSGNTGFPGFSNPAEVGFSIPPHVLESLPFPVFVKNLNGTYLACNRHFCDMLGYTASDILGNTVTALFDAESAEIHIAADKELITTKNRIVYEASLSGPEIRYGLVKVIKSPLVDESGKFYAIIGLISEISSDDDLNTRTNESIADIEAFFRNVPSLNYFSDTQNDEGSARIQYSKEEYRDTENHISIILKALNAGLWEFNIDKNKLSWSEKCYEIFGLESEVDTPEQWITKVFPEDVERVQEMWSRITLKAGWFELEFRIVDGDNHRWIKKTGYYLKGRETGAGIVTGVMSDITDEKNFSEKLFNNQRFFKTIIEDQSELICRIKPDGSVSFINTAFAKYFGVSPDDYQKHLLAGIFPEKDFAKILKLLHCIKPPRHFVNYEQRIQREKSGTKILHWTIRAIYDKDDMAEEYQLVGRDVTEIEESREALRKSEEMFRLIAENSNDIISIHRLGGIVEYVSPSVKHILGYLHEDIIGSSGNDLVYEDDYQVLRQCSLDLQKSIEPVLITFRLRDNSGNLIWFESMIQRQYNNKGQATGKVIAVSRNIHSRRLVEEQQKLTEMQLKEANLTKDRFFSIIAHDLRSPFTSILGFTRLLNEEYDDFTDDERKAMVTQILNSTESTFQLLDNLLAWGKTQLGRTLYSPEYFLLETLIVESARQTLPQAQIKKISISISQVPDVTLFADLNMLRTVLRNLLSNAVKFSFPGGIVELMAFVENRQVKISVTDHGTGIPEETLSTLFSLTEQPNTTKGTANEKGTGLGLILCKEFAERNSGSISVETTEGIGSIFTLFLPIPENPS